MIQIFMSEVPQHFHALPSPNQIDRSGLFHAPDFIRTSIHYEYDFPWGIGALPSEMGLAALVPWGGIVFMMNTRRDWIRGRHT